MDYIRATNKTSNCLLLILHTSHQNTNALKSTKSALAHIWKNWKMVLPPVMSGSRTQAIGLTIQYVSRPAKNSCQSVTHVSQTWHYWQDSNNTKIPCHQFPLSVCLMHTRIHARKHVCICMNLHTHTYTLSCTCSLLHTLSLLHTHTLSLSLSHLSLIHIWRCRR